MLPALERRKTNRSYKNFNVAVYCPVENIAHIEDFDAFDKEFRRITDHIKVGRVYIENFRAMKSAPKEQIIRVKDYFESKGIATSGGITTCASHNTGVGFLSLCYSDEEARQILKNAVEMNAEIFDEFIFDDFYFLNCRCPKCVAAKGNRTWQEFRIEQKRVVTKEFVMEPAKRVNPNCNVIVKFPQWFEDFNETGYDLAIDTASFDSIYTGTETRNPDYSMQHLPKYLGYVTQRFYGSDAPGKNLGGWYDPYDCTYNLTSYLEQAYLTAYAKADELTLFCLGSLMSDPAFRLFPAVMGEAFDEMDEYMSKVGNPKGIKAYHPSYGRGENNLVSYLGMCGIPFEPTLVYPAKENDVFLAESAADDKTIVDKMKETLMAGHNVVVTNGFVRKMGERFDEFAHLIVSNRKAMVNAYGVSPNHGVNLGGKYYGEKEIMITQVDYCTNDVWELAGAYGEANNFPIVLSWSYANGNISVITVPDNYGDVYSYPPEVLMVMREVLASDTGYSLIGPSRAMMFVYDNNTVILDSNLEYGERFTILVPEGISGCKDLITGAEYKVEQFTNENGVKVPCVSLVAMPSVHTVLQFK